MAKKKKKKKKSKKIYNASNFSCVLLLLTADLLLLSKLKVRNVVLEVICSGLSPSAGESNDYPLKMAPVKSYFV